MSGVASCAAEIEAVSWLLLTNDVVRGEPSQTTTALLLKLPPFMVRTNPSPPAAALLGEIELTEGVAGHPPQETAGSSKIANVPKIADTFIAFLSVHICQIRGRAALKGRDFERIVSIAALVGQTDMIISGSRVAVRRWCRIRFAKYLRLPDARNAWAQARRRRAIDRISADPAAAESECR